MSKAVIFFAPGLEECEGLLCVDILRRAGVEVTIAAVGGEKIVKSARQISVVADALAEELDYTVFDACILPGGIPGVPNLKADVTVRRVCRDFAAEGKVVAAICAAPTALAAFGVLNGKKATVYPGMDADLTAAGIEVLYDDRGEKAGSMFSDADLIGIPLRLVVSPKTLADNAVEFKVRGSRDAEKLEISSAVAAVAARVEAEMAQYR